MGIIKIKFLLAENGDSILVKLGNPVETSFFIDGGTINTYSLLKDELSKLYPICTGSYIFEHIVTIIAFLEELRLIYLYTNTDIDKDYILMNDQYFNINTANRKFSEEAINAIWDIDKAKLTEDYHIVTESLKIKYKYAAADTLVDRIGWKINVLQKLCRTIL